MAGTSATTCWDEFTQWQWVTARPQAHGFRSDPPDQLEFHETLDPVRSDAVNSRFHGDFPPPGSVKTQ
jgi:hypothetical protein